jgi:hypothetical protein
MTNFLSSFFVVVFLANYAVDMLLISISIAMSGNMSDTKHGVMLTLPAKYERHIDTKESSYNITSGNASYTPPNSTNIDDEDSVMKRGRHDDSLSRTLLLEWLSILELEGEYGVKSGRQKNLVSCHAAS